MTDYYTVLSVDQKVTPEELKVAYEKGKENYEPAEHLDDSLIDELSITNHRLLLDQAYLILSSPDKKKTYDTISKEGQKIKAKLIIAIHKF